MRRKHTQKNKIRALLCAFLVFVLSSSLFSFGAFAETPVLPANKSVVLYDATDRITLWGNAEESILAPSSTAKLMTGLTAYSILEDRMNEKIQISKSLLNGAPANKLAVGTTMTVRQLFTVMLCERNNDAAYVLANLCSGSVNAFVNEMNAMAESIGAAKSEFINPAGLESGTSTGMTTAHDVALIAANILDREELISVFDRNKFVRNGLSGILFNQGMTDSVGYCRVVQANVSGHRMIVAFMGAASDTFAESGCNQLLDWAKENYNDRLIIAAGTEMGKVPVRNAAKTNEVPAIADRDFYLFTNVDTFSTKTIDVEVHFREQKLSAPIQKGDPVGTASVKVDGVFVGTVPISAAANVDENSFSKAIYEFGLFLRTRTFIASVCMMLFLFSIYFYSNYKKDEKRKKLLQRFKNEHKDIYKHR